jgi:thiosulfate/3-mercaptopyruvate sulfurtransferase
VNALVDCAWLADALGESSGTAATVSGVSSPAPRVVDVRWYLDPARHGRQAYRAGHIPTALFLDVEEDLSAPGGGRGRPAGRHPWPSPEQVARVMGRAGIGPGVQVVAYDDASGSTAARLWYLLRAHGHEDVAVLDGGLQAWLDAGRSLATDEPRVEPVSFQAALRPGFVVDKAAMIATHRDRLVLDARVGERYRGEAEPIDPRAGHIPGARNAPWTENLTKDAVPRFRTADVLRRRYEALGVGEREPVVYCGSGVTACHDLLALHLAGLPGRLYAGSWSEWSSDPALPAATGDEGA